MLETFSRVSEERKSIIFTDAGLQETQSDRLENADKAGVSPGRSPPKALNPAWRRRKPDISMDSKVILEGIESGEQT